MTVLDDRRLAEWCVRHLDAALDRVLFRSGYVSEVVGVRVVDVVLDGAACVHLHGKGRKDRSVPLWKSTAAAIRAWLHANPQLRGSAALLPNRSGHQMTRCNVAQRLADGQTVKVVTGVNVPMLWRALNYAHEPLDTLVARAVSGAMQGVMQVATARPQNQTQSVGPKPGDDLNAYHHQQ